MSAGWWCSKCGEKFRWTVTVCPDCGVDLVDQRPGPPPAPDLELVRVFVAENQGLFAVAKSLLESESIEYLERGGLTQDVAGWDWFGWGYNFILGPPELWVCAEDAEHALARLEGLGSSSVTAPTDDDA